eukprot:7892394-Ditylum_brightwellii.AAC.1
MTTHNYTPEELWDQQSQTTSPSTSTIDNTQIQKQQQDQNPTNSTYENEEYTPTSPPPSFQINDSIFYGVTEGTISNIYLNEYTSVTK